MSASGWCPKCGGVMKNDRCNRCGPRDRGGKSPLAEALDRFVPTAQTRVINIKNAPDGWKSNPQFVYIGRAGHGFDGYFGNPLGTLDRYADWLANRIRYDLGFLRAVASLKGKTLVCFCAPKPCHGETLAFFADNLGDA